MQTRRLKLLFRRRLRAGQRQVGDLGTQAEYQIDEHLLRRFDRLAAVRRFVISWTGLMFLLISALIGQNLALSGYYQQLKYVPGGIYDEGVVGRFTNSNPIYATSDADASVSRLIFAGLFTYDADGKLAGDLAQNYTTDARGTSYTVHLKKNLKWQDGQPLTSRDVVFTYKTIQNPDTLSPLQVSWQGIEVSAPDPQTVVFKLPGVLAAFPNNLTNGIVPEHLLKDIKPVDLRSADFNTVKPVGAGPFSWQAIQVRGNGDPRRSQQQIALAPFDGYAGGKPKLQKLTVNVYGDKKDLIAAYATNKLTAAEGLDALPDKLKSRGNLQQNSLPLRAATMVFFKTTDGLLADKTIRQALVRGTDVSAITDRLGYPTRQVREPILAGQTGYDPALVQPSYDTKAAKQQLEEAGWKEGKGGVRTKDGKTLSFTLTAADTTEYRKVTRQLKSQWQEIGVDLNVRLLGSSEFQNVLTSHDYQALLYGISIGADPDVFVYWDSSQADIRSNARLNLSEWNNKTADEGLEAGRTRTDPTLRTIKYKPFLEAWRDEAPALGLYQPRLLYITRGPVDGLSKAPINTATDRFNNVQNWQIRQAKVTN